ncbi:unnamed protein product, partial [Symbiodinium microadriaticum]
MPAGKTLLAGLGVTGALPLVVTVHDQWQAHIKRQQEEEDRNRIVNRVIHSAFHAAKPDVEIPRKHIQAQISGLLDLHDRSPVLIWGNHQSGKSFALFKAFKEAGFHEGVVHVLLSSDKEVEEALKQAAKQLGRLPIVVLEIPRQVSEMKVLASCSGLAKTLCYDKELAKLIVLASSASMALSFDADAREVRLQIASLSEEECQQEKELAKNLKIQTFEQVRQEAMAEQDG